MASLWVRGWTPHVSFSLLNVFLLHSSWGWLISPGEVLKPCNSDWDLNPQSFNWDRSAKLPLQAWATLEDYLVTNKKKENKKEIFSSDISSRELVPGTPKTETPSLLGAFGRKYQHLHCSSPFSTHLWLTKPTADWHSNVLAILIHAKSYNIVLLPWNTTLCFWEKLCISTLMYWFCS